MRFLLDEQCHETVAPGVSAIVKPHVLTYIVDEVGRRGTPDDEIPGVCAAGGFDALITINVRDFGATVRYYEALLNENIHVVVVRPGKIRIKPPMQASIILAHFERTLKLLTDAQVPTLVKVTPSSAEPRTLQELIDAHDEGLP